MLANSCVVLETVVLTTAAVVRPHLHRCMVSIPVIEAMYFCEMVLYRYAFEIWLCMLFSLYRATA